MSSDQRLLTSKRCFLRFTLVVLSVQLHCCAAADYAALQADGGTATRLIDSAGHSQYRRGAFNPWKGKRTFSPWAGKRDIAELDSEDKRAFNPWSGKRALDFETEKRKFTPWAGKRLADEEESIHKREFNPWSGKRSDDTVQEDKRKFNPWSGKRSSELDKEEKRKFGPWTGKRSSLDFESEKRKFNPWSGKRSALDEVINNEKRKFNPWSGKRSVLEEDIDDEKRAFNPWSGKRAFNPWSGKRAFNPWSGKRSVGELDSGILAELSEREEQLKRGFNPWKGKRAIGWDLNDEDLQDASHQIKRRSPNILDHVNDLQEQNFGQTKDKMPDYVGYQPAEQHPDSESSYGQHGSPRHFDPTAYGITGNTHHLSAAQVDLHSLTKRSTGNMKKFNPWAGKRSLLWSPEEYGDDEADEVDDDDDDDDSDLSLSPQDLFDTGATNKRAAAAFPPWASSRLFSKNLDNYDKSIFSAVRRGFSPWAGKRVVFQPWAG